MEWVWPLGCQHKSGMSEGAQMDVFRKTIQMAADTVEASVAAAGALGGAVVNGVAGGVQGALGGVQSGLRSGSQSIPAAALTVTAVGGAAAVGLVEWPVLLPVGGTVLVLHYLTDRSGGARKGAPTRRGASRSRSAAKGRSA
jgi:hypothetical protein